MTDKEIIIDGVDVSECGHYYYRKCEIDYDEWNNEIIRYNECQNNPNCYYKQLKRKEQECEELKKHVFGLRPELKSMIDKTCCKYNIEEKYYHDKIVEIINNLDKYEQALTEIKEISEKEVKRAPDGETFSRPEIKQILQKISECEVENAR